MNKFILILFLSGISRLAIAQSDTVTFNIVIADPTAIKNISPSGIPTFRNPMINLVLSGYYISSFGQAYPSSRFPDLHKVYAVRCNSFARRKQ